MLVPTLAKARPKLVVKKNLKLPTRITFESIEDLEGFQILWVLGVS